LDRIAHEAALASLEAATSSEFGAKSPGVVGGLCFARSDLGISLKKSGFSCQNSFPSRD
jgi:hypothetical protein